MNVGDTIPLSLAFFACCSSYNILCSFHWVIGISNLLFAVKFFFSIFNDTRQYRAVRFIAFPELWVVCIPPNQVEFFFMKARGLYAFCYTTLCY